MQNNDLNIRAARAMGWELRKHKTMDYNVWVLSCSDAPLEIKSLIYSCDPEAYYIKEYDIHFDTSYDWAMLLVKECNKIDLYRVIEEILFEKLGFTPASHFIYEWLIDATPQQISEAALTVLEE